MKKLITLLTISLLLSSCNYEKTERDVFIVSNIVDRGENKESYGRYLYRFSGDFQDFKLFTNNLYNIGDTIKLTK